VLFLSHQRHVANAYSKRPNDFLLLIFSREVLKVQEATMQLEDTTEASFEAAATAGVLLQCFETTSNTNAGLAAGERLYTKVIAKYKPEKDIEVVRLPYGCVHAKRHKLRSFRMTVINNNDETLVANYQMMTDYSVIITHGGGITLQKYGRNVWIDREGVDHDPNPHCECVTASIGKNEPI
jgi:hypothetical protein